MEEIAVDTLALTTKIRELGIRMRPALPPEAVRDLEARLGVKLPEDYRAFLTQVGNGWEKQVVNRALWQEMGSALSWEGPELLREPFPYTDAWIWEGGETAPLPEESSEAWDRRVEDLLRPTHFGNIPLTRHGAVRFRLILTGHCRGEVWQFTDVGISPCSPRAAFSDWLMAWLDGKRNFY